MNQGDQERSAESESSKRLCQAFPLSAVPAKRARTCKVSEHISAASNPDGAAAAAAAAAVQTVHSSPEEKKRKERQVERESLKQSFRDTARYLSSALTYSRETVRRKPSVTECLRESEGILSTYLFALQDCLKGALFANTELQQPDFSLAEARRAADDLRQLACECRRRI